MEKNNNIFNVLLLGIICFLAVYIIIDKKIGFNCIQPINTNKAYTYENVAGVYKSKINETSEIEQANYTLILGEDGTFKYESKMQEEESILGNYYIKNKKIILNNLISEKDKKIQVINGYNELEIRENGIIDTNPKYAEETKIKTIELIKEEEKEEIYKEPLKTILKENIENKL